MNEPQPPPLPTKPQTPAQKTTNSDKTVWVILGAIFLLVGVMGILVVGALVAIAIPALAVAKADAEAAKAAKASPGTGYGQSARAIPAINAPEEQIQKHYRAILADSPIKVEGSRLDEDSIQAALVGILHSMETRVLGGTPVDLPAIVEVVNKSEPKTGDDGWETWKESWAVYPRGKETGIIPTFDMVFFRKSGRVNWKWGLGTGNENIRVLTRTPEAAAEEIQLNGRSYLAVLEGGSRKICPQLGKKKEAILVEYYTKILAEKGTVVEGTRLNPERANEVLMRALFLGGDQGRKPSHPDQKPQQRKPPGFSM